jgi:hypothetical protein
MTQNTVASFTYSTDSTQGVTKAVPAFEASCCIASCCHRTLGMRQRRCHRHNQLYRRYLRQLPGDPAGPACLPSPRTCSSPRPPLLCRWRRYLCLPEARPRSNIAAVLAASGTVLVAATECAATARATVRGRAEVSDWWITSWHGGLDSTCSLGQTDSTCDALVVLWSLLFK